LTVRDIAVAFGIDVDDKSVSSAENAINGVKSFAKKALGAIGIGFSIAGLADLAEAAADADALGSQFSQVFGDMEDEASSRLERISNDTGVMVGRMKGSFSQIAAFAKTTGMETSDALELTDRSMVAVADSAAFYDRSLEDVTDSLQSFLKGNFENDAALGLSCTETTRNAAANDLYGKSFADLAESEKQLTLLKMVEDANATSGALGQAARESDTWSNQLGNLKQSLKELKAAAGKGVLQPAILVLKGLSTLAQAATKQVSKLTAENGLLTKAYDRMFALVKKMKPAIDRMMETMKKGATAGAQKVKGVIDRLGGVENVLKILAIVAAAFFLVMNWSKIINGAKTFFKLLTGMGKLFSVANLKILAIVAVVVILALIVEDFINFLLGNDSVIGTIFDRCGIGADNARQAIFKAWGKIKEFLLNVWDILKTGAGMFVDTIKSFFDRHSESIKNNFMRAWGIIKTFLSGVWTFISQLATTLFGGTEESIDGSTTSTKDKILAVWQAILDALSAVWDALYEIGSAVFNAIATIIEFVFKGIQMFWNSWGSTILAWFKGLWDNLGQFISGFLDVIKGLANFISSVFSGDWSGAWEAIKEVFSGIWDMIAAILQQAWNTISTVLTIGLGLLKSLWETIWGGISSFFQSIWNAIVSFFSGIWSGITNLVSTGINYAYNIITTVLTAIQSFFAAIWNGIASFFAGIWNNICSVVQTVTSTIQGVISSVFGAIRSVIQSIWNAIASFIRGVISSIASGVSSTFNNILSSITNTVGNIKNVIVNGFNAAIAFIKGLPSQAVKWGADFINGLKNGIMSGVQGIVNAVKGIGDKIKSFLHFSVPDEGPLTDYESWMPDFMGGLAEGIEGSQDTVLDKIKGVANGISTIMKGATADASTAAASSINNTTSTVTQNVNIDNTYNGGGTEAVKNVSRGMKKSATDATTQMANALAYARG
jgi:phage-related protein